MSSHDTATVPRGTTNNNNNNGASSGPGGSGKRPLPDDYPSGDSNPPPSSSEQQQSHRQHYSRYPSAASSTRQPSAESSTGYYPSAYPPPPPALPNPTLNRQYSVESSHSQSPGPESLHQNHHPQHQRHRSRTPPYPPKDTHAREAAYPGSGGGGESRESGGGGYPASRDPAYPSSRDRFMQGEQQHLLAYRGSPTPCYKHGAEPPGVSASDYPLKRQRSTRSTRSNASRRRQNEDGCTTCLRGTLHCYNVCILIIGCAALGVGVWLLVTDFGARNVTPIVGNQLYEVTTYLLIAGGGAVALLAFCGCCGTIREDKCVLSFYGTTLAIVLIVLGVACGLAFFFKGVISDHIQIRMKNSLTKHYGVDVRTSVENRRVTESWDAMQRQLQCCGIAGNSTSSESWSFYSSSTEWNLREIQKAERRLVPESCCAKGDIHLCTGIKSFKGPPLFKDSHLREYREVNPYLYTTGCYDKLVNYLNTYSTVVGCVAAIVPLFLVLGIVVSFCLCARVAGISQDDEVEL